MRPHSLVLQRKEESNLDDKFMEEVCKESFIVSIDRSCDKKLFLIKNE